MKFRDFNTVLKKELKDLFRDKKSIISTILIPIIIYPIMMFFIGGGISDIKGTYDSIGIAITGELENGNYKQLSSEDSTIITNLINQYNSISGDSSQKIIINNDFDDYNKALVDGDIQTIITVQEGIADIENQANSNYRIGYIADSRSNDSVNSTAIIQNIISNYSQTVYNNRLESIIGDTDYTAIIQSAVINVDDLYTRSGTGNYLILMIIPMLVTILISIGGATIAVDLIAGEKERGTFEPLLSTSASRFSILSAKYLVVIIFAFINGIIQIISMAIGIALMPEMSDLGGGGLSLSIGGIVLGIINILLLAAFFCSIMLCLASTAKTFKEASTKTSFLIFLPLMLSYSVMFTDAVNINLTNMLIPVVNVVCVIKMILSGYINYIYFSVSAIENFILLAAAVYITLKMFSKESLITRG
jgi:sodium transport system permease protein